MRGLYGQSEGNENRSGNTISEEFIEIGEILDKDVIEEFKNRIFSRDKNSVNDYFNELIRQGYSFKTVQALLTKASYGAMATAKRFN